MLQSSQFTSPVGLGAIALASFSLGFLMAIHVSLLLYSLMMQLISQSTTMEIISYWCIYAIALCYFHISEFLVTAAYRPLQVNYDSFLLNQGKEYQLAITAGFIEYFIESYYFPNFKSHHWMRFISGGFIFILGLWLRITAMITASSNFSHAIEDVKRKEHKLVTNGVYQYIRHPSYCGWFLWTIGSQLFLGNPICFIAFTYVSWHFFNQRIPYEEYLLKQFFPVEYPAYRQRTISGVPFIP